MSTFRFTAPSGSVVIAWRPIGTAVDVSVKVKVDGFHGHGSGQVTAKVWEGFVAQLRKLDEKRKGKAEITDNEFVDLTIQAIDGSGHMAVSGELKCFSRREIRPATQRLRFDLEFEPGQIATAAEAVTNVG